MFGIFIELFKIFYFFGEYLVIRSRARNFYEIIVKGEVNPKIKFVLFERTFKITE